MTSEKVQFNRFIFSAVRLSDLTLSMRRVTSGVRPSQRSRFLVLTKRSAASGDENAVKYLFGVQIKFEPTEPS